MRTVLEERHLIDRYLQGELSGIELDNFNLRMKSEDGFRSDVELQKLIYAGIQKANHDKLKAVIVSSIGYRKLLVPFALKMIVTFFVVTLVGISFWFYVGNETVSRDQSKSWFAFLNSKKSVPEDKEVTVKQKLEARQQVSEIPDSSSADNNRSDSSVDSTKSKFAVSEMEQDSTVPALSEADIIVKQDELLISSNIPVADKSNRDPGSSDGTHTEDVVRQLNPAADLPESEPVSTHIQVEFWVSPVNYRGYKMSKNKLILFGIDEPQDVKLYRVNDTLYMTYLKGYYRLNDSFEFVSYHKLRDNEIPLAIK